MGTSPAYKEAFPLPGCRLSVDEMTNRMAAEELLRRRRGRTDDRERYLYGDQFPPPGPTFHFGDTVRTVSRRLEPERTRIGLVVQERAERSFDSASAQSENGYQNPQVQVWHSTTNTLAWHSRYAVSLLPSCVVAKSRRRCLPAPLPVSECRFAAGDWVVTLRAGSKHRLIGRMALVTDVAAVPTTPVTFWCYLDYVYLIYATNPDQVSPCRVWMDSRRLMKVDICGRKVLR